MSKFALFARRHTHTRQNTGWFVRYHPDSGCRDVRFDSWLAAVVFWLRLKRHPFDYQPHIYKGE